MEQNKAEMRQAIIDVLNEYVTACTRPDTVIADAILTRLSELQPVNKTDDELVNEIIEIIEAMKATELINNTPRVVSFAKSFGELIEMRSIGIGTFSKVVTDLCTEIETLKKANEWILVEDGLPEIGVLVQTKNINDFNGEIFYDHDKIIMPEFEKMFDSDQMIGAKVTEWKPINN